MEKIKGQYIFDKASWKVRYKVEDGDEQHYEQVMLHPNNVQHAKENKTDWFVIRESPNLYNGGSWEPMAIVVPSDKIEDVAEQIKGKELFKRLNEHAMSVLTEVDGIPEPKPKDDVVSSFNKWQRKDIKRLKKLNMNENKTFWDWSKIIDIILLFGIIFLAALDKDGWGWLLFAYIVKNF
jgi:hypothetical protein